MPVRTRTALSALLLASAVVVAGCADPARQRSKRAIGTLDNTRGVMADARKYVDASLVSLGKLEAKPANLAQPFRDFQRDVKNVDGQQKYVGDRVQDMRVRAAQYRDEWQKDASQNISDPELRAAAQARAERVAGRYEAIDAQAQEVRTAYGPFITELKDLETFLANDLTYAAIETARPMMQRTRASGEELRQKIDAVLNSLDDTSNRLAPTTAPRR